MTNDVYSNYSSNSFQMPSLCFLSVPLHYPSWQIFYYQEVEPLKNKLDGRYRLAIC